MVTEARFDQLRDSADGQVEGRFLEGADHHAAFEEAEVASFGGAAGVVAETTGQFSELFAFLQTVENLFGKGFFFLSGLFVGALGDLDQNVRGPDLLLDIEAVKVFLVVRLEFLVTQNGFLLVTLRFELQVFDGDPLGKPE